MTFNTCKFILHMDNASSLYHAFPVTDLGTRQKTNLVPAKAERDIDTTGKK